MIPGEMAGLHGSTAASFVVGGTHSMLSPPGGVLVAGRFRTCLACGHVWSSLDVAALRDAIRRHGNELTRQCLDEIDFGMMRDLPDTELARDIAAKISRLDALARSGATEFVRVYRDLLGTIWDDALKQSGRWPKLTREEKLELFGWVAKKESRKGSFDELA